MSPTSYQLLHSAMFLISGAKVRLIFEKTNIRQIIFFISCGIGGNVLLLHILLCNVQNKTMPVSKTKAKLVDVARQLFAKMGVENTTMNDIALASKKGRRTLYTYFKSKEDIYLAVVESQLDILLDTMKRVADKCISPDEKMLEMIYTRLDVVKEVVYRNGTLRADFFRDIWKVEKARKQFDEKEVQLFKEVLREGMEKGVFQIDDLDMTAELVHYCVKGIEVPYIRGQIGANLDDATRDKYVARIVFGALHRKDPKAL